MVIRQSAALEIERLIDALLGPDAIAREAATARLRVIGTRAAEHVLETLARVSPSQQVPLLQVLEGLDDSRVLPAALRLVRDPETALAALAVVDTHLPSAKGRRYSAAIDTLTQVASDSSLELAVRRAALASLERVAPGSTPTLVPADERAYDPTDAPSAVSRTRRTVHAAPPLPASTPVPPAAGSAALPENPDEARRQLAQDGGRLPLSRLQDLIGTIRLRERDTAPASLEWAGVRAVVHRLLAQRGSKLALYDLRDTLERWDDTLPVGFVAAMAELGDAGCLDPLAIAFERSESAWVREQLLTAFRDILQREQLTRRHAAVRKAARRSPQLAALLFGAARP